MGAVPPLPTAAPPPSEEALRWHYATPCDGHALSSVGGGHGRGATVPRGGQAANTGTSGGYDLLQQTTVAVVLFHNGYSSRGLQRPEVRPLWSGRGPHPRRGSGRSPTLTPLGAAASP
jgi:hypothetical protein